MTRATLTFADGEVIVHESPFGVNIMFSVVEDACYVKCYTDTGDEGDLHEYETRDLLQVVITPMERAK